jgi:predicted nucleic acid-binding protein
LILADTDVLIDFLAGIEPVRSRIAAYLERDMVQTTAITAFELLSGAREGKRGDAVRELVKGLPVAPLERKGATHAAAVRQQLETGGERIGMADSLIAGIALAGGFSLLTRNRKHFNRVSGLTLIDVE